jgi:hypothetical protein
VTSCDLTPWLSNHDCHARLCTPIVVHEPLLSAAILCRSGAAGVQSTPPLCHFPEVTSASGRLSRIPTTAAVAGGSGGSP